MNSPSPVTHHPSPIPSRLLRTLLAWALVALIAKVTGSIIANYAGYLPPDFGVGFLKGRDQTFFDWYAWAFYAHIAAGPVTMLLGVLLLAAPVRSRWPHGHRWMGRVQVGLILLILTPSGLAMAFRPAAGFWAGLSLALLALATALTAAMGLRHALARRYLDHRRWMWRCFLLLNSAIVLRLTVSLSIALDCPSQTFDILAIWASWVVPITLFERFEHRKATLECGSRAAAFEKTTRRSLSA